jgi:DNA-directed RNA polymerase specialized sigma24 family protein
MEPTTPDAGILIEHREFIRRLAQGLVRDPHAAEDVAQEVFVRALEHPPKPGNLTAWLGRVARNVSISRLRSEGRRARRERTVAAAEPLPPVDEAVGGIELQQRGVPAGRELRHVPPQQVAPAGIRPRLTNFTYFVPRTCVPPRGGRGHAWKAEERLLGGAVPHREQG